MANSIRLQDLLLLATYAQQRADAVTIGLPNYGDFTSVRSQLSAFHGLLQHLQQVPEDKDSAFNNIKTLLQSTTKFCNDLVSDLQAKAKSPTTDWSSSTYLGGNIETLSDKLKLYVSSLAVGAIDSARLSGLIRLSEQALIEFNELIHETLAAAENNIASLEQQVAAVE